MEKKGYRLSVDDNIRFLENLAKHPEYTSIFEDPFLNMHRRLHETYGTKTHFNLFFQSEDGSFDLTQVPDRFKQEWTANADWMRLSFHARSEFPAWPYLNAGYEQVYRDCEQVHREILRFAGPKVLGPVTTVHFAELTREGAKALQDLGIKMLLGDFSYNSRGERYLDYYLDADQFEAVRTHCFYRDKASGMQFCCCDIVLDCFKPEDIGAELDRQAALHPGRRFVDILIHEQYFYEDYKNYRPYYQELIETGIRWCTRQGYEPVHVTDMIEL